MRFLPLNHVFTLIIFISVPMRVFAADYYVSSSAGSDSFDGSANRPFKSIAKALSLPGKKSIFLKRGDVFYESIKNVSDTRIAPYGKGGGKPVLCGFRVLENPKAWRKVAEDLWRLDLHSDADFSGMPRQKTPIFDSIGFIYDSSQNEIHGRRLKCIDDMRRDWDFVVSSLPEPEFSLSQERIASDYRGDNLRYLYLKLSRSPAALSLSFATYITAISSAKNCAFEGFKICGFALHGFQLVKDSVLDGLWIDAIGGGMRYAASRDVIERLGNGIEFWASDGASDGGNTVRNCLISRTYDCGSTIQGVGTRLKSPANIRFENNRFFRCRQAFEHFLSSKISGGLSYENCSFTGNIGFECGLNGFDSPEPRDAMFLSYDKISCTVEISKNKSYFSNGYFGRVVSGKFFCNEFFLEETAYLYKGLNGKTILASDPDSMEEFSRLFGNNTNKVKILSASEAKALRAKIIAEIFPEFAK